MDSKNTKRKSLNFILIIFIILAIITLVILTVYLISASNNTQTDENTVNEQNSAVQINIATDTNTTEENITSNSIEDTEYYEDIETIDVNETNTQVTSETENEIGAETENQSTTLNFNNTSLTFDSSINASVIQNNGNQELQLNYTDFNFKMLLGTNNSYTFEELKTNISLNTYLESTYNITTTSPLKTGTLADLDVILCTISDIEGQAYFIITPLNNNEVIYAKVYNTSNYESLVEDLSKPLEEISSIKSNLQN